MSSQPKVIAIIQNDYSRGYAVPTLEYCLCGLNGCYPDVPHGAVTQRQFEASRWRSEFSD
jgi:hypothetical protein